MGIRRVRSALRVRRLVTPVVVMVTMAAGTLALSVPPAQAVTGLVGYACGYYTNTSMFSPNNMVLQGCGQSKQQPSSSRSPSVTLPTSGSGSTVISASLPGAISTNGPATFFSGPAPVDPNAAYVPSGVLSTSTNGTIVVQAVSQVNGVGPAPFHTGDYGTLDGMVYAKCTASSPTSVTFTVQITGGSTYPAQVETSTDPITGDPVTVYNIPSGVNAIAPNTRVDFTLNQTPGVDHGYVMLNEQIHNADGSWTVTGMHEYMQGPNAFGDMVVGQVKCYHP